MRLPLAIFCLYLFAAPAGWTEPLQGRIEQTGRAQQKVLPGSVQQNVLPGNAQQDVLPGNAQQNVLPGNVSGYGAPLYPQQGTLAPMQGNVSGGNPLQGNVAGNNPMQGNVAADPDFGNQELDIAWDAWRNRLIQAIQANTLTRINVHDDVQFVWDPRTQMMQSRYPDGTSAWYACSVLPNGRIVNIRITLSSRYPTYDQAVWQAINDLQGNRILQYPQGSRRQIVTQEGNVAKAQQSSTQTYQFGDIERQRR